MARINRFEDLDAWKKARELSQFVYQVTSRGDFSKDFALRDQMRRAAISVLSNIAEGFERDGDKEFRQFLSTAKASFGEIKAQLYVALDAGYIDNAQFENLYHLVCESSRLIAGFMRYLQQSPYLGNKLKNDDLVCDSLDFEDVLTRDTRLGTRD